MKTSFKKIMAGATAVAIVAMNMTYLTVNAAALNGATALATTGTITITSTGAFTAAEVCTASVTLTNSTAGTTSNVAVQSCTTTDVNTLTIAAAGVITTGYYTVAFSTATSKLFGTTATPTSSTSNNVLVSGQVLPILSMKISGDAINLGVITPGTIKDSPTDTTITVKTNAVGGYIVQAAATNFTDGNVAHDFPFTSRSAMVTFPALSGFSLDVVSASHAIIGGTSVPDAVGGLIGVASTFSVANGAGTTIAGASAAIGGIAVAGTTNGDDIVINYAANASSVQEAGNYSTTVTYTTSGTF